MKNLAMKIRKDVLILTSKNKVGHIGSMLSMADILAVLFSKMDLSSGGDRFVLSKGHAGAVVAAALMEKGIIDKKTFDSYYDNYHQKRPSSPFLPGVKYMSCSLGHGIGVAVGLALAAKMDRKKHLVYAVVGNGECNEGSVWEAMMAAGHYKLDNLIIIVDHNHMQAMGHSSECMDMGCLEQKFEAFNARVVSVDGHNFEHLTSALSVKHEKQPLVIMAHTIKGKGVSFMENNPDYHYGYADKKQLKIALGEVKKA